MPFSEVTKFELWAPPSLFLFFIFTFILTCLSLNQIHLYSVSVSLKTNYPNCVAATLSIYMFHLNHISYNLNFNQ